MPLEFRVRWQREGRRPTTRIYQSWDAAVRKMRIVQVIDEIKAKTTDYADMPDLVGPPVLEVREVGQWGAHAYQPEPTDFDRKNVREWVDANEPTPALDQEVPF